MGIAAWVRLGYLFLLDPVVLNRNLWSCGILSRKNFYVKLYEDLENLEINCSLQDQYNDLLKELPESPVGRDAKTTPSQI